MDADAFELDHLFILTDVGAPEAQLLAAVGLTEGDPNVHPGQGTANRRFFFRNAFLELLWVSDLAEAQSQFVEPTQLGPRWLGRHGGGSPFGVILRPAHPGVHDVPFPSWEYRPPYLPDPLVLHVRSCVPLSEPWWGYFAKGQRPDAPERPRPQPLAHRAGFREITWVRLHCSAAEPLASPTKGIELVSGPAHLAEITFDGGVQGIAEDFRPRLPLLFRW